MESLAAMLICGSFGFAQDDKCKASFDWINYMAKCQLTNNIRKLRFENGEITQQALADMAGVTRQTIIATEQGKYTPSLTLAFKIADVFELYVEDVFSFESDDEEPLKRTIADLKEIRNPKS